MACAVALGTGVAFGVTAHPALADPIPMKLLRGLQIQLSAPGTVDGSESVLLDVQFRGGNVRSIELYIDGALVKQQAIGTQEGRGVISFALEAMLLTAGSHDILIKAFDQNGNVATATTRLRVKAEESSSLVRLVNPKKNAMVQGVLPLEVTLDASLKNPYVAFFLDNDFLALSNFAPYTYNWDSAKVANGRHVLTVKVYDGETAAQVHMISIPIRVNNPGGFTNRQEETPDLRQPQSGGPVAKRLHVAAEMALPENRGVLNGVGSGLASALRANIAPLNSRPAPITSDPFNPVVPQIAPKPLAPAQSVALASPDNQPLPTTARPPIERLPGVFSRLSNPQDLAPLTGDAQPGQLFRQTPRLLRSGNIAALPGRQLEGASVAPIRVTSLAKPSKTTGLPTFRAHSRYDGKTFEIAFDNSLIAFDVPPRVENGLPLAPFRAIFEHTGGTVKWYGQSKTVRAYNSAREIEFRIGDTQAKINNQSVQMETRPYLEQGRAVVPISFIQDAMDVNVEYDPATGRLRIESKK
jgi:hypothetical protein